jgi:hypothetical protein
MGTRLRPPPCSQRLVRENAYPFCSGTLEEDLPPKRGRGDARCGDQNPFSSAPPRLCVSSLKHSGRITDSRDCHPCSAPNPCGDPPPSTHLVRPEGRAPRVRHRLPHRHPKASCNSALRFNGPLDTPRTTGGTSSASPSTAVSLSAPSLVPLRVFRVFRGEPPAWGVPEPQMEHGWSTDAKAEPGFLICVHLCPSVAGSAPPARSSSRYPLDARR